MMTTLKTAIASAGKQGGGFDRLADAIIAQRATKPEDHIPTGRRGATPFTGLDRLLGKRKIVRANEDRRPKDGRDIGRS